MSRCGDCKLGCHEQDIFYCEENLGYEQCIDRLQDALYAIDRPRGEWIVEPKNQGGFTPGGNAVKSCSNCGWIYGAHRIVPDYNFCPNCGAKMRGKTNEM